MPNSRWPICWVLWGVILMVKVFGVNSTFTSSISLFARCDSVLSVAEDERFIVSINGRSFPPQSRSCHVQFVATENDDVLIYRVTKSQIYKVSDEVAVDSSRDGDSFVSKEFITTTSPPRNLHKEWQADRYVNVSAFRTSGYVTSNFDFTIQIYGEDFYPGDNDYDPGQDPINESDILGIVLGVACAIAIFVFAGFFLKKSRCGFNSSRQVQRNNTPRREQHQYPGPTAGSADQNPLPPSYLPDVRHPGPPVFPPPYSAAPSGGEDIFTVQSQSRSGFEEPPPSYDEAMKTGMREVTI